MVQNCDADFFFYLCYSLLMNLGQDWHQHPTVHSGELARGGSVAVTVGVSDMGQVMRDT